MEPQLILMVGRIFLKKIFLIMNTKKNLYILLEDCRLILSLLFLNVNKKYLTLE